MVRILTVAEYEEIERLDYTRTQGEWTYKLPHESNPHWAYVHTGRKEHDAISTEDAAFVVVAAANNMSRLLATIKSLREALSRQEGENG